MTFFMCGYTFDIVRTMKEGVVMTEPLYLHPAWERTLSQRDLDAIKKASERWGYQVIHGTLGSDKPS